MLKIKKETKMNAATLRLFNAIRIKSKNQTKLSHPPEVTKRTIQNGYIIDPHIFIGHEKHDLLDEIETIVGISGEKANASFHKSWAVVKDTPIETLVIQQIMHYFTTYGFETIGIYNEDTVYIPHEKLEVPQIKSDIPLVVIKAMTPREICDAIIKLGSSGIALSEQTLDDIMTIIETEDYKTKAKTIASDPSKNFVADWFVSIIKNRELKTRLSDYFGLVPKEPVEFLRHLVSKLTNESLLIKNDYLIEKIKASNGKFCDELIKYAPTDLASIFYRYKPLFLAMKSISKNKTFFNRLRKNAKKIHKPLPEDFLNSVTSKLKHGKIAPKKFEEKLTKKLENASIFRKIRLANALKFRTNARSCYGCQIPIVYRIRNGKGWATETERSDFHGATDVYLKVEKSIVKNLNVKDRIIYIPDFIDYALPATEKQFTGHFPTGTSVKVPKNMIVGIHWENTDKRVDLDLSAIDTEGKVGWDALYRKNDILFSGDITDAPKSKGGASEMFYIKSKCKPKILNVNYYNMSPGNTVDCKIFVAHENPTGFESNYMVDPNNILATATINITGKQNIIGLIADGKFYFGNIYLGNGISIRSGKQADIAREYMISSFVNSISLKKILKDAGAIVVNSQDEAPSVSYGSPIDLSPTAVNKNSIIELLK